VPPTASRQNAMKALDAVTIRTNLGQKEPCKSAGGGKLRRFGHGSKTVDRMMRRHARNEPAHPRRRQIIEAASRHFS
jgi:hypothetical protein